MSKTFYDEDVERIVVPTPTTLAEPKRETPEILNKLNQKDAWERELGHFTMGTDFYYKHRSGKWVFTRAVRRFAEIFGAWEIVDELCSYKENPRNVFGFSSLQFARITACKGNAVLELYDDTAGDSEIAVTWTRPYGETVDKHPVAFRIYTESDLPDISVTFCRENGVLYAIEEH